MENKVAILFSSSFLFSPPFNYAAVNEKRLSISNKQILFIYLLFYLTLLEQLLRDENSCENV